jgi:hypothetical protein
VAASARARAILLGRTLGWLLAALLELALLLAAVRAAGHGIAGWAVCLVALAIAGALGYCGYAFLRLRPPVPVTATLAPGEAPELYRIAHELADQLGVPEPDSIELSPDCDSWLEQRPASAGSRSGRAGYGRPPGERAGYGRPAFFRAEFDRVDLVRGGPLWPWARLLPVAHRRRHTVLVIGSPFLWWLRLPELRALLAPVIAGTAAAADPRVCRARELARRMEVARSNPVLRHVLGGPGRLCARWAHEMEHDVAVEAAATAAHLDPSGRASAHEQVQLAYVGWDRLLTRLATPAWRIGVRPIALNAGLAAALAELSRRDRLAGGFGGRLDERPACDVLDEPGSVDARLSRLAADLFWDTTGMPDCPPAGACQSAGSEERPVREADWSQYVVQVVEPIRRGQAGALADGVRRLASGGRPVAGAVAVGHVLDALGGGGAAALAADLAARVAIPEVAGGVPDLPPDGSPPRPATPEPAAARPSRQQRSDLLVDHVLAFVECAAVDMTRARWVVDWLDGPVLATPSLDRGALDGAWRAAPGADLPAMVAACVESGDDRPLRQWLAALGVSLDKPVEISRPLAC